MENEKRFLILNKIQWKLERGVKVWGFDWSDEEIENAIKSKDGKIGEKFGVDCYVTKDIKQLQEQRIMTLKRKITELIRKVSFLVAERTTVSIFDSEVVAMQDFKDSLFIITKNGTMYEKKGDTIKIHRASNP